MQKHPIRRGLNKRIKQVKAMLSLDRDQSLIIDTESTGMGDHDQIIELTIIDGYGRVLFDSLINPTCEVHPKAQEVHQIDPNLLKKSPSWKDIAETVEILIQGKTLFAYNADFDRRLINQTYSENGMPPPETKWQCVMKSYALFFGRKKKGRYRYQKLTNVKKQLGIEVEGVPHRAKYDSLVTLGVIDKVLAL